MFLDRFRRFWFVSGVAAGFLIRRHPFVSLCAGAVVCGLTVLVVVGLPIPMYDYLPGATDHNLHHPRTGPGTWRHSLMSRWTSSSVLPRNWCPLKLGWSWDFIDRRSSVDWDPFTLDRPEPSIAVPDERFKTSRPELPEDVVASLADQHANDVSVFVSLMGFGVIDP